jgi:hypothetical protein
VTEISPVTVEAAIRACSERIARGVMVCDERYRMFLEADHAYDVAFAGAYLTATGAAHEKKFVAELGTQDQRRARDVADAAYKYADRQARALESELRAWQSVNASLRVAYSVAGTGDR